jgi:hypothetical protein
MPCFTPPATPNNGASASADRTIRGAQTICPLCGLEATGQSVGEPDAQKFTCKRCVVYGVSREMVGLCQATGEILIYQPPRGRPITYKVILYRRIGRYLSGG